MTDLNPRPNGHQDGLGTESDPLVLQRWKLLDWRFLLPNPQPRTVGFGGAMDSGMEEALRLLDPGAVRIGMEDGAARQLFEMVLLSEPDARLFKAGAEAVQPGGWLCVRIRRSFRIRSGPRTLLGWQRSLKRRGFQEVSVQWYAPGLDLPSRIVPVGSRTAVLETLRRHEAIRFGKTKQFIGRVALDLGLFAAAIPEGVVTGQRGHTCMPVGEH
ncbi:hypothetical protein [Arthrobacter sp. 754]|uniref:hypothetical protein n=1 Tax=Arthrobacter sp. 754 TaxID=3156315 RepID=UPI003399C4D0